MEEATIEMAPEPVLEHPVTQTPAEEVTESVPAISVPSQTPSPNLEAPRVSRPSPQASVNAEDRTEGSSRNGRASAPRRPQYFHCCNLYRSDGRPNSWKNWEMGKECMPHKSNLQESQFIRPTDKDGENPTTRIVIDNLDAGWFRKVNGVPSYKYVTEALEFFTTKRSRCWSGRAIDGVEYTSVGYATVDFDSVGEALKMFDEFQGRRLRGHTWHWRLEFVDPQDETHGGRKVIRPGLVPDSVMQALAAELEASTRRHGRSNHSDDGIGTRTVVTARPPTRTRPQLSNSGRSLFAGAMATVVQDRRVEPTQSARAPRRPQRS